MDKENIDPNSNLEDDYDDMPELMDSSDNEQVNEEPFLVLSDNTATQFRSVFAEPACCFYNMFEFYYAWMGWMLGMLEFPHVQQLSGVHRQTAMLLSTDIHTRPVDSDSEDFPWWNHLS